MPGKFTEAEMLGLAWSKMQKEKLLKEGGQREYVERNPLLRGEGRRQGGGYMQVGDSDMTRRHGDNGSRDIASRRRLRSSSRDRGRDIGRSERSDRLSRSTSRSRSRSRHRKHKKKSKKESFHRSKKSHRESRKYRNDDRDSSHSRSRSRHRRNQCDRDVNQSGSSGGDEGKTRAIALFGNDVYKDYAVDESDALERMGRVVESRSRSRERGSVRGSRRGRGSEYITTQGERLKRGAERGRSRSRSRSRSEHRRRHRANERFRSTSRSRSRSPLGDQKWTHSGFIKRAVANIPSPERVVPADYVPPKERWVSRAGGVAIMKVD